MSDKACCIEERDYKFCHSQNSVCISSDFIVGSSIVDAKAKESILIIRKKNRPSLLGSIYFCKFLS